MFAGYKGYSCINRMTDMYSEMFDKIVDFYAERLNGVVHDGGTVYTMHDFDHHCCDLYKIISNIILNDAVAYENAGLDDRELYILNLAVLLHDIGMTGLVDVGRDNHSEKSAQRIGDDYSSMGSPLSQRVSSLSKNEIDALKLIVKAHSDVKGKIADPQNNGLRDQNLTNCMPGKVKPIRARLLANILRMADELDITSERLGDIQIECELEETENKLDKLCSELDKAQDKEEKTRIKEQVERYRITVESKRHWNKLHLFKDVARDIAGKVKLVIDDNYIEDMQEKGETLDALAENIASVYLKIDKEFKMFQSDVKADLTFGSIIAMKDLELSTNNPELESYLVRKGVIRKEVLAYEGELKIPTLISEEIGKKIKEFIDERNLFEVGHFKLHNNVCSRDWILVDEVLETQEVFKKCEAQFLLHIKNEMEKEDKKCLIVGVDLGGILIASKLAYLLHLPYSYVVPLDSKRNSSTRELELHDESYDRVILITDVIATFETVKNIIEEYNLADKVSSIYALFFRNTEDGKYIIENQDLVKKTYVLNNDFNIEIRSNDNCRYRDCDSCKASNRRYD